MSKIIATLDMPNIYLEDETAKLVEYGGGIIDSPRGVIKINKPIGDTVITETAGYLEVYDALVEIGDDEYIVLDRMENSFIVDMLGIVQMISEDRVNLVKENETNNSN